MIQRSKFRINHQWVNGSSVNTCSYGSINGNFIKCLIEHSHCITIGLEILTIRPYITPVHQSVIRSGNVRRSCGIHLIFKLVTNEINITTCLQAEPICNFHVGSQRRHCTITFILVCHTVLYPIRILVPFTDRAVFISHIPILKIHITWRIIFFKFISIWCHIHSTWETIDIYQWIKVVSTCSRTVLYGLRHQCSITIQLQTVIKEASRFTKSEIMLLKLVRVNNTFSRCIGIREISLSFFITGHKRNSINSSHTITEEIIYVLIVYEISFFAPTARTIFQTTIWVLEFRQTNCMVYCQIWRESYFLHACLTLLCGNQNHTVSSLRTIKSCCRSSLQNTHTFNILRI